MCEKRTKDTSVYEQKRDMRVSIFILMVVCYFIGGVIRGDV